LDFNISEDEVLSAIKKLKRNKSGGLQLITNDILMAGKLLGYQAEIIWIS
jgi:hypothetical protein